MLLLLHAGRREQSQSLHTARALLSPCLPLSSRSSLSFPLSLASADPHSLPRHRLVYFARWWRRPPLPIAIALAHRRPATRTACVPVPCLAITLCGRHQLGLGGPGRQLARRRPQCGGGARARQLRVVCLKLRSRQEHSRRRHGTRAHRCRPSLTPPSLPHTCPPACPCLYAGRAAPSSCLVPFLPCLQPIFQQGWRGSGWREGKGERRAGKRQGLAAARPPIRPQHVSVCVCVCVCVCREAADPPSARELPLIH